MEELTKKVIAGSIVATGCLVPIAVCFAVVYVLMHFIIKYW